MEYWEYYKSASHPNLFVSHDYLHFLHHQLHKKTKVSGSSKSRLHAQLLSLRWKFARSVQCSHMYIFSNLEESWKTEERRMDGTCDFPGEPERFHLHINLISLILLQLLIFWNNFFLIYKCRKHAVWILLKNILNKNGAWNKKRILRKIACDTYDFLGLFVQNHLKLMCT